MTAFTVKIVGDLDEGQEAGLLDDVQTLVARYVDHVEDAYVTAAGVFTNLSPTTPPPGPAGTSAVAPPESTPPPGPAEEPGQTPATEAAEPEPGAQA
jgi:hypothetical protein